MPVNPPPLTDPRHFRNYDHLKKTGQRIQPNRYVINNCTRNCTLNPKRLPGEQGALVHGWYEAGDNNQTIINKANVLGLKFSNGSVGRHRAKHLVVMVDPHLDPSQAHAEKKSDLEVLEIIIGRGAQQVDLATTKISAEQLLRAIELKHKLTEGSVFDSLFGALVSEGDDAYASGPEAPAAVASDEEVAQAAQPEDIDP